jgi:hypothetical protein
VLVVFDDDARLTGHAVSVSCCPADRLPVPCSHARPILREKIEWIPQVSGEMTYNFVPLRSEPYQKAFRQLLAKKARDLSEAEAYAILGELHNFGQISLYDPAKCKDAPRGQMKLRTDLMGVEFWHASGNNGASRFGSVGAYKSNDFFPTPQFAVVLCRLAERLRNNWGATEIVWGGIGQGSGKSTVDCHIKGHCIDFYGATTKFGVFDVKRDWYLRPVYGADGKPHRAATNTGFDYDRWGTDNSTSYRLLVNHDAEEMPDDDPLYYNPRAREFFLDVYSFVSEECAFGPNDISPSAMKGGGKIKAGFTVHPDYPTALRVPHNDHMHFQLGNAYE